MIIRTYECTDCKTVFEVQHDSGDEPWPDCPMCSKVLEWRPQKFAITGVKSKAIDMTQQIMEQDYGISNFSDNSREGDVAVKLPAPTTAEREASEKAMHDVEEHIKTTAKGDAVYAYGQTEPPIDPRLKPQIQGFWGGQQGSAAPTPQMAASFMASAKQGPEANVDPMRMLADAGRKGMLPSGYRIVGRG